jgi:hypothetical protein
MQLFIRFMVAWLALCFALTFFIIPLYLLAIYPEVPEPFLRFMRSGAPYGVLHGSASIESFIYRLLGCGSTITIGTIIAYRWLGDFRQKQSSSQ